MRVKNKILQFTQKLLNTLMYVVAELKTEQLKIVRKLVFSKR